MKKVYMGISRSIC